MSNDILGAPSEPGGYFGFGTAPESPVKPPSGPFIFLCSLAPDGKIRAPRGSVALCSFAPWWWRNLYGGKRWQFMRRDPKSYELTMQQGIFNRFPSTQGPRIFAGSGSPDGAVEAPFQSLWIDNDSGKLWVMTTFAETPKGWVPRWLAVDAL